MSLRPYLVVSAPSGRVSTIREVKIILLQVRNEECMCETRSFNGEPLPPSVYLGRHWGHSCDKIYQPFRLHFWILQVIKNWTVGSPGNEATFFLVIWEDANKGSSLGATDVLTTKQSFKTHWFADEQHCRQPVCLYLHAKKFATIMVCVVDTTKGVSSGERACRT